MSNIFRNAGIDKYAHLGVGGLLCAIISTVPIMQDGILSWKALLFGLFAALVVFVASVFKEYFADKEFEWADIAYAMFGCALYLSALTLGIGLYAASH